MKAKLIILKQRYINDRSYWKVILETENIKLYISYDNILSIRNYNGTCSNKDNFNHYNIVLTDKQSEMLKSNDLTIKNMLMQFLINKYGNNNRKK